MKIQCDVCSKEAAAVFCTADEAALCQSCDNRVHNANKLASKHPRFSLLNPQVEQSPLCDICQKRQAFVFCQEDRALLCRECDFPIHKANELTKKHNRFLLTGVKLSAAASLYQGGTSSCGSQSETGIKVVSETSDANYQQQQNESSSNPLKDNQTSQLHSDSNTTNSISEYLIETLPGWHVDDFLDPSYNHGSCKIREQISTPFTNEDSKLRHLRFQHPRTHTTMCSPRIYTR